MMKKMLAAAALAMTFLGAQAAFVTGGIAANQDPTSFIALSFSAPGTLGYVAGGALYPESSNFPGYAARPNDAANAIVTHGTWLAAGPGNTSNGGSSDATIYFGDGTAFVSFLWGSPDSYNELTVTTTGGSEHFFASDFSPFVITGNQDYASYLAFTATGDFLITSMRFSSPTQDAFEASNFSVTSPIPEPETYALMLAGLAAMGFVSRRRKS